MFRNDTIAAISTGMTNSGIGVVRISGEDAVKVADRIFRKPNGRKLSEEKTFTIHYGHIYDENELIEEVLVMLMRGPRSYTAEDTVESDWHGGVLHLRLCRVQRSEHFRYCRKLAADRCIHHQYLCTGSAAVF